MRETGANNLSSRFGLFGTSLRIVIRRFADDWIPGYLIRRTSPLLPTRFTCKIARTFDLYLGLHLLEHFGLRVWRFQYAYHIPDTLVRLSIQVQPFNFVDTADRSIPAALILAVCPLRCISILVLLTQR